MIDGTTCNLNCGAAGCNAWAAGEPKYVRLGTRELPTLPMCGVGCVV